VDETIPMGLEIMQKVRIEEINLVRAHCLPRPKAAREIAALLVHRKAEAVTMKG
jgi:hypothetical protein